MKIATVMACPTLGGRVSGVNDKRTRAIPGVVDVIVLDHAVAVVGEHFWAAKQGLAALDIEWDHGENADLTTAKLRTALSEASLGGTSIVAREVGKKPVDGKLVEATYQLPMLAHATMEPLNTTVWVTPAKCEIWVGTQVPTRLRRRGGENHRLVRGQDRPAQPVSRRRFRPAPRDRLGGAGGAFRDQGQLSAQGHLDPGGGHPPRHRAPHVPRQDFGGARRRRSPGMVRRPGVRGHGARPLGADGHGQERTRR